MYQTGYDVYRQNQANANTPGNTLVLLFEASLRFMDQAVYYIENKHIEKAHIALCKAQDIFYELRASLDYEVEGTDMAYQLDILYDYFINQLVEANMKKDKDIILEIKPMVSDLTDSWRTVVKGN